MRCASVAAVMLLEVFACAGSEAAQPAKLNKLNIAVLDAQGQPATGLHQADFRILEDGKPQDIAFFRFTGGAPSHITVVLLDLLNDRIMSDSVMGREIIDSLKNLEVSENMYLYFLTSRGELYPVHPLPKPDTELTPARRTMDAKCCPDGPGGD